MGLEDKLARDGDTVLIEVYGEGPTDIGKVQKRKPRLPDRGVVSILLYKLCGKPRRMMVKPDTTPQLQGKKLSEKADFVKTQAFYNGAAAVAYVIDSEGGDNERTKKQAALAEGRNKQFPDFPMAVGVAQPCIEAWLLSDAAAIRRALQLPWSPEIPSKPEELQAPQVDRNNNPKTALLEAVGSTDKDLSVKQKESIAQEINDLPLLRQKCPAGFGPFADEVEDRIKPLFHGTSDCTP